VLHTEGSRPALFKDVKESFESKLDAGAKCPCCTKFAKRYPRKLNSSMARALIWMVIEFTGDWIDMPIRSPRWIQRTKQFPTLRWWGLVERRPNTDPDTKHSGFWRPTEAGIDFANNETEVPQTAVTYDGVLLHLEGPMIDVREALGTKFNYADLMRGVPV
jgi:hypothetical protein